MRYYLDTGVFVTPILKNQPPKVIEECKRWQERVAKGEIAACTSYLTWDEVTHVAGRAKGAYDAASAEKAGDLLLRLPGLALLDVDDLVVRRAQHMLGHSTPRSLRPRDCIHASTALIHAGGRLVTLDSDFTPPVDQPAIPGLFVTKIE